MKQICQDLVRDIAKDGRIDVRKKNLVKDKKNKRSKHSSIKMFLMYLPRNLASINRRQRKLFLSMKETLI